MRYGPDDKFWGVVDPTPVSELGDVLFETTLHGLELQFKAKAGRFDAARALTKALGPSRPRHEAIVSDVLFSACRTVGKPA
jgi:hypothetical protein